jgi:uncharacterized protein YcbK (DUF882 family)
MSPAGAIVCRSGSGRLAQHFRAEELECGCDRDECKSVVVHWALIRLLERMRKQIAQPLYVSSGYRCPQHNQAVGGAPSSLHLAGMAADVQASTSIEHLASVAEAVGAGGIGLYPRHLHVDVGEPGRSWEGDYEDEKTHAAAPEDDDA